jgi:hypothetical protein
LPHLRINYLQLNEMGTQNKRHITQLLKQYYKLLECQEDISFSFYDDEYHLKVFQYETEILSLFGLPNRIKYHRCLYEMAMSAQKEESDAATLFEKIKVFSEKQQYKNNLSCNQLIVSDGGNKKDPFEILPDLAGNVNGYSLFLYNEKLFNKGDVNEKVLEEFKILKKLNYVSDIYLLCFDRDYKHNRIYEELKQSGLKYLSEYLRWYHSRIK